MDDLIRNKKEEFKFTGIEKLTSITIITTLGFAFINTIWAVYMDSFIHSIVLVGFFSSLLTLISFLSYFLFIPLIEKTDKSKIYGYTLLLFTITYILFAINTKFYFFVLLAFVFVILNTLRVTSFGLIVKDKSPKESLSKNEGIVYTFANTSFVLGPLIAGLISSKFGINTVFLLAALFVFSGFILLKITKIRDGNIKKKTDDNILKNFKDFFKSKKRILAYFLRGGVNLWWVLIYLFIPLFIIRNNMTELWIGYFLFAVAVPLILLEYFFGKLAGKIGFKKLFKIGFLIPCILVIICFFMTNIYIILLLLVLASIGLAMLEPTTEAYFFDISKSKEILRFYGPFNTTISINRFIGKIFASILLIFLPFKFIFLLFGAFMFIMFLISFKIKDIIEEKRN